MPFWTKTVVTSIETSSVAKLANFAPMPSASAVLVFFPNTSNLLFQFIGEFNGKCTYFFHDFYDEVDMLVDNGQCLLLPFGVRGTNPIVFFINESIGDIKPNV